MVKCILGIKSDQAECLVQAKKRDNDRELAVESFVHGWSVSCGFWSFMEVMPCMEMCSPMIDGAKDAQSSSIAIYIS